MITTVCLNPSFDKTATLSELKPGELNRLEQVRVDLGGKGLNVATVLSRLGVQTRCVGCLGSENASLFLRMVGREKLTFEYLMVSGEVRTNLKLCEKNTKAITEINEPGPSVSEEELQSFLTLLEEKAQDSSYVVFSGRLPQNCGEDTYQRCIHSLPGKKCVLDAAGESLLRGIKEKPYLIKPNLPEIEGIVSRELKTLRAIRGRGPAFDRVRRAERDRFHGENGRCAGHTSTDAVFTRPSRNGQLHRWGGRRDAGRGTDGSGIEAFHWKTHSVSAWRRGPPA